MNACLSSEGSRTPLPSASKISKACLMSATSSAGRFSFTQSSILKTFFSGTLGAFVSLPPFFIIARYYFIYYILENLSASIDTQLVIYECIVIQKMQNSIENQPNPLGEESIRDPPQQSLRLVPYNRQNVLSPIETKKNRLLMIIAVIMILSLLLIITSTSIQSQKQSSFIENRNKQQTERKQGEQKFKIFKEVQQAISNKQQADPEQLKNKINELTNLSKQQYDEMFKILNGIAQQKKINTQKIGNIQRKSISWIDYMPKIKQIRSDCKIEYAFAAVGAVQALINIQKYKNLTNPVIGNMTKEPEETIIDKSTNLQLAEQQILDCCKYCEGCKSNIFSLSSAFDYIVKNGVTLESEYPYTGKQKQCAVVKKDKYTVKGFKSIKKGSCNEILNVLKNQPVIVSVDSRDWGWNYIGGIMSNCGRKVTSYGILVGKEPGDENNPGYWLVRMPWSRRWGEKGYIKIKPGNTCGICEQAYYPYI